MQQSRDYLMRFIERLSQALGDILNRLLRGQAVEFTEVASDLNSVAHRAGFDLELARHMAPESLLDMVTTNGTVDNHRCWVLAELLFLHGLKCGKVNDVEGALQSYERSASLYGQVQPEKDATHDLPEPRSRVEEVQDRMLKLRDDS